MQYCAGAMSRSSVSVFCLCNTCLHSTGHGGNAVINRVDPNGWTALHYAAKFGSLASVKVLVQSGASLTQMNSQGQTALKIARLAKKANVVNYLQKREQKQGNLLVNGGDIVLQG